MTRSPLPGSRPWLRDRLRDLPGWHGTKRGSEIRCEWRFDDANAAAAFLFALTAAIPDAACISFCAWNGRQVSLTLSNPRGLADDHLLALARRISAASAPRSLERSGELLANLRTTLEGESP